MKVIVWRTSSDTSWLFLISFSTFLLVLRVRNIRLWIGSPILNRVFSSPWGPRKFAKVNPLWGVLWYQKLTLLHYACTDSSVLGVYNSHHLVVLCRSGSWTPFDFSSVISTSIFFTFSTSPSSLESTAAPFFQVYDISQQHLTLPEHAD